MQDIEREAMDIQLQDKLLEYKQQMGLLGSGTAGAAGKQIGAGQGTNSENADVLDSVIETEANDANRSN
jgi:hypothetical protein